MIAVLASMILLTSAEGPQDAKVTPLKDGWVKVTSSAYSIEVPSGWKVTEETPWGQRKMAPKGADGELGVMTAPPSQQSWERLYQTSLFFILRENPRDKAQPYKLVKREDGLEAASFSVINPEGFAYKRYFLLKHPEKGLLALSVRIPDKKDEADWEKRFARLIKTAEFRG